MKAVSCLTVTTYFSNTIFYTALHTEFTYVCSEKSEHMSYLLVVHSYYTYFLRVIYRHFVLSLKVLQ
jgi:hypothetical protein